MEVRRMIITPCILATKVNSLGRATRKAERYRDVWIAAHGPIPDELDVGHLCHDQDAFCLGGNSCLHRACYALDHLGLQTRSENLRAGNTFTPETIEKRVVTWRENWTERPQEVVEAFSTSGRDHALRGYAIVGALDPLQCEYCPKICKGIRGLSIHRTAMHGRTA